MSATQMQFDDRGYEWVCEVRPGWNSLTITLLIRYLIVWGFLIAVFVQSALNREQTPEGVIRQEIIGPIFVLALIGLAGYYLIWGTVLFGRWMVHGERMVISGGIMTLQGIPTFSATVTLPLMDITGFDVKQVNAKRALFSGPLVIQTGGRKYRFGRGLQPPQVYQLIEAIRQRFGQYMAETKTT